MPPRRRARQGARGRGPALALSAQHGAAVSAHLVRVGVGVVLRELLERSVSDELLLQAAVLLHNLAEDGRNAAKLLQCGLASASARRVARSAELGAQTKQQLVHAFAALACARGGAAAVNALADHSLPTLAVHLAGAAADAPAAAARAAGAPAVASADDAAAAAARDAATREGVRCLHIIAESAADGAAAQRLADVPGVVRALQAAEACETDEETKQLARLTLVALNARPSGPRCHRHRRSRPRPRPRGRCRRARAQQSSTSALFAAYMPGCPPEAPLNGVPVQPVV